jgi:DNA-binding response OmpR family regulator
VERAFGFDYDGLERTVDAHVANLRRKIEPNPGRPIYVLTVPGVGYKLAGEPATEGAPSDASPGARAL